MSPRLLRNIALAVLALYAFAQASVALAACEMDRSAMAQAMAMPAGDTCEDCVEVATDALTATCLAHCTADLKRTFSDPVSIPDATCAPLPPLPKTRVGTGPPFLAEPLAAGVPRRILLHSFQV